jgi:hypothetical protein
MRKILSILTSQTYTNIILTILVAVLILFATGVVSPHVEVGTLYHGLAGSYHVLNVEASVSIDQPIQVEIIR